MNVGYYDVLQFAPVTWIVLIAAISVSAPVNGWEPVTLPTKLREQFSRNLPSQLYVYAQDETAAVLTRHFRLTQS